MSVARKHKYNARPTIVDGITFASAKTIIPFWSIVWAIIISIKLGRIRIAAASNSNSFQWILFTVGCLLAFE